MSRLNRRDWHEFAGSIKCIGRGPRPLYGRWTYWEKFDYLAVFWGVAVIGGTGLILWYPAFCVPLDEFKKDCPREYQEMVDCGELEQNLMPAPSRQPRSSGAASASRRSRSGSY